jgi:hypothetical protein
MVGDDDIKIVTPHEFRIELQLDKMEERTMIWGDNWGNLTVDYRIYINDKIVVNLDGRREFLNTYIFNKHKKSSLSRCLR